MCPLVPVFYLIGRPVTSTKTSVPERIVIATRESRLAMWQAEHVRDLLQKLYPACRVELLEPRFTTAAPTSPSIR